MKWKKILRKASLSMVPWYDGQRGWLGLQGGLPPEAQFLWDAAGIPAVKREFGRNMLEQEYGQKVKLDDNHTMAYFVKDGSPVQFLGERIAVVWKHDEITKLHRGEPTHIEMANFPLNINEFNELLRKAKEMMEAKFMNTKKEFIKDYTTLYVKLWKGPDWYDASKQLINRLWQEYQQSQQGLRGKLRARKYRRNIGKPPQQPPPNRDRLPL